MPVSSSTAISVAAGYEHHAGESTQVPSVVLNNVSPLPQDVDLVIERPTFPVTGSITILLPEALFDRWWYSVNHWWQGVDVVEATGEIRVTASISATIGAIPLYAAEETVIEVRYDALAGEPSEVRLYQLLHGTAVGGISHQWVIPTGDHRVYLPLLMRVH